jgi:hypothetical protein
MTLALRPLQELFYRLITAPRGVADGLTDECQLPPGGLDALIRGDPRLPAIDRLGIYANMYFYRLLGVLKEDYPATLAVVGADHFHNLVTGYLLEHRPSHPSVFYAGAQFAGYLRGHPLRATWPFLADLSRLERALIEVFVAPDAPSLDDQSMRAIAPQRWPTLRLRAHPATEMLQLEWRVGPVVHAVENGAQWIEPVGGPVAMLVWRMNCRSLFRELAPFEHAALAAARDGATFAVICERAAAAEPSVDPASTMASVLSRWLSDGILAADAA